MRELPEQLMQKLRTELRAGEKIVWAEQPIAGQMMKTSFWLWLFFMPWTLFALFWTAGASGFRWPDFSRLHIFSFFPLFGLPFIFIGLCGLSTPLWIQNKAKNTVYAVTNLRLLICVFGKTINIQAFHPKDVTHINRVEKPDGSGDLYFSTEHYRDSDGDNRTKKQGFAAVRDVKNVERIIEDFIKANQTKP
jgi:hypothetical protein